MYNGPAAPLSRWEMGAHLVGGLLWLALIALIVVAIMRYVKHGHTHHSHNVSASPLEAAKLRYAKGDITKAEFEQIKKDLA